MADWVNPHYFSKLVRLSVSPFGVDPRISVANKRALNGKLN